MNFKKALLLFSLLFTSTAWAENYFPVVDENGKKELFDYDIYAVDPMLNLDVDPLKEDPFKAKKEKDNNNNIYINQETDPMLKFNKDIGLEVDPYKEDPFNVNNNKNSKQYNNQFIDKEKYKFKNDNSYELENQLNAEEEVEDGDDIRGELYNGEEVVVDNNAETKSQEEINDDKDVSENQLNNVEEIDDSKNESNNNLDNNGEKNEKEIDAEINEKQEYKDDLNNDGNNNDNNYTSAVDEKADTKYTDYFNESTVGEYFKETHGEKKEGSNGEDVKNAETSDSNYHLPKYFHFPIDY